MPVGSCVSRRRERAASDPAPMFALREAASANGKSSRALSRSHSEAHFTPPMHLRLTKAALPVHRCPARAKEDETCACALSCLRFVMSSKQQSCHDLRHPRVAKAVESGCRDICSKFLETHRATRVNGASTICNNRVLPRKLVERVGSNTGRIITLALGDGVARSVSGVSERCRR